MSMTDSSSVSNARLAPAILILFCLTLFASAGLMFALQPMVAKTILPILGGSPMVWAVSAVCFQGLLLFGYSYSHLLTRLHSFRLQAWVHVILLVAVALSLPLDLRGELEQVQLPEDVLASPADWLVSLLVSEVGIIFFLLSTTAPLLQRWFSALPSMQGRNPYPLYALSNTGNVLGMALYILWMEPHFALSAQFASWSAVAGGLLCLLAVCCMVATRAEHGILYRAEHPDQEAGAPKPPVRRQLYWLILSFTPSALLLSTTKHLTTEIAPMPLLWVLPLSLYLISYMLTFTDRPLLSLKRCLSLQIIFSVPLLYVFYAGGHQQGGLMLMIWHLLAFIVHAVVCHRLLYQSRPCVTHLTRFYLVLSLGGVMGGFFVTFIAPQLFTIPVEYPLLIGLALMLRPAVNMGAAQAEESTKLTEREEEKPRRSSVIPENPTMPAWAYGWWMPILLLVVMGGGPLLLGLSALESIWHYIVLLSANILAIKYLFDLTPLPRRQGVTYMAIALAGLMLSYATAPWLAADRNFFGALKVTAIGEPDGHRVHQLVHGVTVHGAQRLGAMTPLNYYHPGGPLGDVLCSLSLTDVTVQELRSYKDRVHATLRHDEDVQSDVIDYGLGNHLPLCPASSQPRAIAGLGMGVGSLAAYMQPQDRLDFYEINPAVIRLAQDRTLFTFLSDMQGDLSLITGDARLKVQEAYDAAYDAIIVDVFNSDAIPVHLMTVEALALYRQKLAPGGVIALHLSNRYVDLRPVIASALEDLGMVGVWRFDQDQQADPQKQPSLWALVADDRATMDRFLEAYPAWFPLQTDPSISAWTDDHASLVPVLKF